MEILGNVSANDTNLMRQRDIFVPDPNIIVEVIGAGGIGSWVVLALSKMGFQRIRVWDGDMVDSHNVSNQMFTTEHVKVETMKVDGLSHLPGVEVVREMWDGQPLEGNVIVSAVDNMMTREKLFKTYGRRCRLFVDGRTGGQTLRVLTASIMDIGSYEYYESTLFPDEEMVKLPCGARAIIDIGLLIGGMISNVIRNYLSGMRITRDLWLTGDTLALTVMGKGGELS